MRSQEHKIRRMLHDLRHALNAAINDSPEATGAVDRLREEGWDIYFLLGRREDGDSPHAESESQRRAAAGPAAAAGEPSFRLSSFDVNLLKSLGIDPTRSSRRRRAVTR